jgi:hypothetical protein
MAEAWRAWGMQWEVDCIWTGHAQTYLKVDLRG